MSAAPVLCSDTAVTLIGGGPASAAEIAVARGHAPRTVAADGGADRALSAGVMPEAVIGDMDSISAAARAALPQGVLHPVAEQDSTDFEKCLSRIEAPLILAVGAAAGRLDHALAAFNTLVRWPARRCVILGPADLVLLAPPRLSLALERGTAVSLFPMAAVRGESSGLTWPIGGIDFAPDGPIGTSNRAEGAVRLSFAAPRMLLILPVSALAAVLEGLATAPRWPGA